MVRNACLILAFGLAGCATEPADNTAEVAQINARNALGETAALRDRVDQLESDKEDLESRLYDIEAKLGM